jgi:hypothetical protein
MRERRSVDLGIEARRLNSPCCEALPSETLAGYVTRALRKADRSAVEAHLRDCDDCRTVLQTTRSLLAAH